MNENRILSKINKKQTAFIASIKSESLDIIEYASRLNYDGIHLDAEHGSFSVDSIERICQLAISNSMTVTARVSKVTSSDINLFLDRGVQGIMGPHIETLEEASLLADYCLFPLEGKRSWGGGRGTEFGSKTLLGEKNLSKKTYAEWANKNIEITIQIESVKAINNLDEILKEERIDRVAFGPHDLAADLGFPGEPDHIRVAEAHKEIEIKSREAGKRMVGDLVQSIKVEDAIINSMLNFKKENG
jgi:4-hydroxy-2-oxoheptanedioate aldolase